MAVISARQQELIDELQRRGETVSTESVLDKRGSDFQEFKKFGESLLKGTAKGLVDIVGGWGNLYDYLKGSKDPSAFSSTGITQGIKNLTGVDPMLIPGYRGAYEFGQAGGPAAAMTAAGLPGLFSRTPVGVAGEFGVAGTTGLISQSIAPDSPLAQLAIQSSPYLVKGGLNIAERKISAPIGQIPADLTELQRVGPLTPGQATGSRVQLAEEARIANVPKTEGKAPAFKESQAQSVSDFVENLFDRASSKALSPAEATNRITTGLQNYGKSLSSKLKSDAQKDFGAAKASGGMIDTTPIIDSAKNALSEIPIETLGFSTIQSGIKKILDEFAIPEVPATSTPSVIVTESGLPARTIETAAIPAQSLKISIDRLQKNLSAWGDAAWSGSYALNGSNVFEGVAPGQVKGIARAILRGYKNALDDAIDNNVPGADKLKQARDKFSQNLAKIDEFADKPFVKMFGKTANELVPEVDVIPKLAKLPESQRNVMIDLLRSDAPELLDTSRRAVFDNILTNARGAMKSAPEGSPSISLEKLLGDLNSSDNAFLFNNAKDRADALLAIKFMQKALKSEAPASGGGLQEVGRTVAGLGGGYQARNLVAEVYQAVKDVVADPNKIADVVFNPDTVNKMAEAQRKGKLEKAGDLLKSLSATTAKFAPRVGPMVSTDQPTEPSEQVENQPSIQNNDARIKELEDELRRRGEME